MYREFYTFFPGGDDHDLKIGIEYGTRNHDGGETMHTTVHTEYPRPYLERDSYFNLNGLWDFSRGKKGASYAFSDRIAVPFSPESRASGLGNFILQDDEELHYRRTFVLPPDFVCDRVFLHFGAVDYECRCRLNGVPVGQHRGGFLPFFFDITSALKEGENVLELDATDPTDGGVQARGKQKLKRGGIWYTPQSGIWQTVWMESVSLDYIRDLSIVPDIDAGTVSANFRTAASTARVKVMDGSEIVAEASLNVTGGFAKAVLQLPEFELWSPENPKLYRLAVSTPGDYVGSWFGMRKFSVESDGTHRRLFLNNRPYFHRGLLDQGYWSEGLLTPPDDAAIVRELALAKEMGFNMLRKHIKIESQRWYWHCDRLGLLVWQDFVCGGGPYRFLKIALLPFLGFRFNDKNHRFMERTDAAGRLEFESEMAETVRHLGNSASLAVWVLFNEGWGQFDSRRLTEVLKGLDSSRIIDSVSGWHDQGPDSSDLKSLHIYYTKPKVPKGETRAVVLSEFGGYSLRVPGHVYDEKKEFGYKVFKTAESLAAGYKKLVEDVVAPLIPEGLSATVYTQLSDVEEEINGLVTCDRAVVKIEPSFLRSVNASLAYPGQDSPAR